jgi:two-component system, chemotaxis family, response regulator Rcp1
LASLEVLGVELKTPEKQLSVLLVEDNNADVYLFQSALRESCVPIELAVVKNGKDAWKRISEHLVSAERKPDLIVLDLNLPGMSGREILDGLVTIPSMANVPIGIFTSSGSESGIVKDYPGLRLSYEKKTPDFQELYRIVGRLIGFSQEAQPK